MIFALSYKKEYFHNSSNPTPINMPKGFVGIKGNFFSQGENPTGINAVKIDPDSVAEKYAKFDEISLDKKNMIVKQGYHVRKQLCLDNFCLDTNDLSKFDDDKKVPRFYKKCENYKRPIKANESINNESISSLDWRDSRGTCDFYKQYPEKCINAETYTPETGDFKGISAKDACCVCKSSKKEIDDVMYNEIVYNHNNKNNIPDLLCSRDNNNELCISGQELRILNGSKSINIKSDWDNHSDYIRPYNTQYGDGNNNSGLRDYILYQKDNDVMGIGDDKNKAISRDKENVQRIETCNKHVSSKNNCLSGNVRYEKINDPRAQLVYEGKWIIRYDSNDIYYNDNSSDLSSVPENDWKYNKLSFNQEWGNGANYRGTQNRAKNGATCQKWTSQRPRRHNRTPQNYPNFGLGNHNYCRNPDGKPDIWCYVNWTGGWRRWDFCDSNTIRVKRLSAHRPAGGTGETDLKQVSVTGHSIGDGRNVNGTYREAKTSGHYCRDSGKSDNGADYGLEYIILPGKKDDNSLASIDNYTHIHDHSHIDSPHYEM